MLDLISIKEYTDSATTNIVIDTIEKNKQVLVFVSSKSSAEKTAEMIALQIKKQNMSKHPECERLAEEILNTLSKPTKQCEREAACIKYGIAFHHAGLLQKQKTAIENAFRTGIIKCIACTPTLCLAPDTEVWHDLSETRVSTLDSSFSILALKGKQLFSLRIEDIKKLEHNQSLIEIRSALGHFIHVTKNHKMLVKRNKLCTLVSANDIKKGDKIATIGYLPFLKPKPVTVKHFVKDNTLLLENREIDGDLSYFIGLMLGDGYSGAQIVEDKIVYVGSPCIVGRDEEVFSHVSKICVNFGLTTRRRLSQGNVPQFFMGKNKWFREFLVRVGIDKGTKKHIAYPLMEMQQDNIAFLLRGLFDTDGWVQKKVSIGFSNISVFLVKQMQKLLLRFGIISRVRRRKESFMKIYEKIYKTRESFELTITHKKSIWDFYRFIGFGITRKQDDLLNLVSKIGANLYYVSCQNCNYKIYNNLFSGRTREHNKWGTEKKKVIMLLGREGELGSKEIHTRLRFLGRKKDLRLNHHYQLISKKRRGAQSTSEWYWSLNKIGQWIYNNILVKEADIVEFFRIRNCPLCREEIEWIIKKGWRSKAFEGHIFWDIVRSVEETKKEAFVYDVVLPKEPTNEHMFVANGFIVHNSMGVDLPAYRAIIRDLRRFSKNWGQTSISVLEYQQMAGRAGRPGKDTRGEAITIAKTEAEKENIYEEFVIGEVEDIYSKLAVEPVLRTYLLSLIATEYVRTKEQILSFFSKTFWAYQYKDLVKLEKIINKMLKLLKDFEFIETNENEFSTA
ncbi:MAG: LAGLIDADG family homing endonuclease, partial [Nanoarchaeota archaeon]